VYKNKAALMKLIFSPTQSPKNKNIAYALQKEGFDKEKYFMSLENLKKDKAKYFDP